MPELSGGDKQFRLPGRLMPIKLVHKMTEAQVRKEMSIHPLDWVETIGMLLQQHIIVFRISRN